jgi:hypothetical protein
MFKAIGNVNVAVGEIIRVSRIVCLHGIILIVKRLIFAYFNCEDIAEMFTCFFIIRESTLQH